MQTESFIPGKDASLESSIVSMQGKLDKLGFHVEERSWLNPVDGVWSVHVRDRDCPLLFTNGKGGSRLAALASALGEFFERLSCNYFWTHYYLGDQFARRDFAHYPRERWFQPGPNGEWPGQLLTPELRTLYDPDGSIDANTLVDLNSGDSERGICALPYVRQRDGAEVWFPVNLIGNLYVSNGMSAGNTEMEARSQALSEILERHIKFRIISEGLCLPDVPEDVIARYPRIAAGIRGLREAGFGILVKDASLGGEYPVMNVTLLHPEDQGCFSSFGAHPRFEIALERALTELLQGRGLDALAGFPPPGFDLDEIAASPNIEIHFVDSSGIISWNFLGDTPDFEFCDWNFSNTTAEDYHWLIERIHRSGHDVYIADFTHLGVYACRILVPGMSEIYPLDESGMGEQQRRQRDPRSHPASAGTGRAGMCRPARHAQRTRPAGPATGRHDDRSGRRSGLILGRPARRRAENHSGAGLRRRRGHPRRLRMATPLRADRSGATPGLSLHRNRA